MLKFQEESTIACIYDEVGEVGFIKNYDISDVPSNWQDGRGEGEGGGEGVREQGEGEGGG